MGAAHHRRVGLGAGPHDEHGQEPVAVAEEPLAGRAELQRETGVDDVAARQAEVEIATFRTHLLGDLRHECDDVVVRRALDLGDPVDVDAGASLDGLEGRGRDQATRGLRPGDRELDPEHLLEAGAF